MSDDDQEPDSNGDILQQTGAFGNPDAARTEISKAPVVEMGEVAPHLAISRTNFSTHVIVGRKGAGKTLHLRNLGIAATDKTDIIAISDPGVLKEHTLKFVAQRLDPSHPHIVWQLLWRRSIFSFLGSLFYAPHKQFAFHAGDTLKPRIDEKVIQNRFAPVFTIPTIAITPVQYVETIASRYSRSQDLYAYLTNPLWAEFENVIAVSMHSAAPIFVFMDALDAQNENFPQLWHDCQYGLFLTIYEILTQAQFGGRLHVMTTVRESVYRAVLRTEHATRFFGDSHLRLLHWGWSETEYFLKKKVQQLNQSALRGSGSRAANSNLEEWLGFDIVANYKRDLAEPALQYILRHTRCLPRDIVIVGNLIAQQKERCKSLGTTFNDGHLRRCIEIASRIFARETIKICVTELLLTRPSVGEYARVLHLSSDDIDIIKPAIHAVIREFVLAIGTEIFTPTQLQQALHNVYTDDKHFFMQGAVPFYRIDHVLWRNGLIAYLDDRGSGKKKWIFDRYSESESDALPTDTEMYGFHPSVIDLFGIPNSGASFVY